MKIVFTVCLLLITSINYVIAQSPAIAAIEDGNLDSLQNSIEILDLDIDERNSEGRTLLHVAVSEESTEIVEWLLDQGAEVNVTNDHGTTPLSSAIYNGSLEIGTTLLDAGFDVTTVLNLGSGEGTYLQYAMSRLTHPYGRNRIDTIQLTKAIYDHGETLASGIPITSDIESSALFWAIVGDAERVRNALSNGASNSGLAAMATTTDSVEVLELLNALDPLDPDEYLNFYPIRYAIYDQLSMREFAERLGSVRVLEWIRER